jgi:hypothetical protein
MMAPLEQKVAPSKTPDNQRQNEQPFGHRAGHHLAFTKSAQEPDLTCKVITPIPFTAHYDILRS